MAVKPLRLVMVVRHFWPMMDGPARLMGELAAGLVQRGCGVTILTAGWHDAWPGKIFFRGVPVVRVRPAPRGGWHTARYLHALASWLRRRHDQFDVVCLSGMQLEALAAALALRGRRPLVLRAERGGGEGDCRWQEHSSCGPRVRRRCAEAAAVVAPWASVRDELLTRGYRREQVHLIANGVAIPPPGNENRKALARAVLGQLCAAAQIPAWVPLAVYVGRLDRRRGLGVLVEAWRLLAGRWPDARLWIVGAGADQTFVEGSVARLGLEGRIHLLGAMDCVDEPLAAADVFVWPAPEFGSGLAVLEAMAAGVPVVACDTAEARTVVGQNIAGALVPGENAPAIAAALDRLFADPQLARRLGAAGRQRAEQHYSAPKMVEEHLRLLEALAAQ